MNLSLIVVMSPTKFPYYITLLLTTYTIFIDVGFLLDLKNNQVITVEKENGDSRENRLSGFIGWNKKGDKFVYSQQSQFITDSEGEQPTQIREIKIYDLNLNKSFTVVKLHPHPTNPDEYLVEGKPVSNVLQFALY